ncbi:uncharacterized protein METZ01_LOCUS7093 [marine metagenome]|uniref:Uncharacterized protein n=1 Tax=marine metagenome TaxID=408172 RepID=A0A381NIL6_9ZZZZ
MVAMIVIKEVDILCYHGEKLQTIKETQYT